MPFFILLLGLFSFSVYADDLPPPSSDELAYCGYGSSCRTAYSSPVVETRLARYDPDMFCGGYVACSGLNHYCGSSPAIHTSQAPSTVGQFVMTRWSSYRVWDKKEEKWLSCVLQSQGGEGDLTVDYNKTPTKEDCLARPVINETFIGGRTENGVFATIQGCLYRAQGVVTCDPDNMERCAADWTPVDIAPCVGEDCTDTEENGGSSGGSGGSGNGSGGSSGGSGGSGSGSGGSSGGSGGSGNGSGGSSGGSGGSGNGSGGSSGGSGGSGNGSNGGSGEGSVGGDSFILSRILGVVIDISNKLSFSAIDVDKSLQSYDSQLDSVISGETQNAFDPSSFDGVLKDAFSSIPDTWLKIDFDRLLYSGFNSSQPLIFKIELNFTSIWPSLGVKTIIIDTTSYTSLYDSIIRPIIEYSLYLLTALACYFIVRRAILMNSNI